MSIETIIDSADMRFLLDSKDNSAWTKNVVGSDTYITFIPVGYGNTLSSVYDGALLVNNGGIDQLYFPPGASNQYGGNIMELGSYVSADSSNDADITLAGKAIFDTSITNKVLFANNDGTFKIGTNENNGTASFFIDYRGAILKDSGGVDNLYLPLNNGVNYFSLRIDGPNNTGDLIFNGVEYNNLVADGTSADPGGFTTIRVGGIATSGSMENDYIEYLLGAQTVATLTQLRDLDAYVRDEYSVWPEYTVNGSPKAGIVVTYSIADDRETQTNLSILDQVVSDAQGNAPLSVAVPAGKHLKMSAAWVDTTDTLNPVYHSLFERWIDDYPQ